MVRASVFAFVLFGSVNGWAQEIDLMVMPERPNPEVTQGDLCDRRDPDFSGLRYKEKIAVCRRNVSRHKKAQIYEQYGIPERCRREYTIDHFVPLSIGGSNQPENLWPEHVNVKATRRMLEQDLFEAVARGEVRQRDAIRTITEAKMNPPRGIPESRCR